MSKELIDVLKKQLKSEDVVEFRKKDIVIKSKNRVEAKNTVEQFLKKSNIGFSSVMKRSKSSSLEVHSVPGWSLDLIYKPHKAKGADGVAFEKQIEADLKAFFNGEEEKFQHPDVIKRLTEELDITPNKPGSEWKIIPTGSQNQKRGVKFQSGKLTVENSSGATLKDITVKAPNGKPLYISLKMSESYYLINAGVLNYFKSPSDKKKIAEFFGMDGKKLAGFGPEYLSDAKPGNFSVVKRNLEELVSQSFGHDVVIVHKVRTNKINIMDIKSGIRLPVVVSNLTESSYVYPEVGKRKYANIKFKARVSGKEYEVNCQFRGTTGSDTGPRYLRLLMRAI